MQKLLSSSLVFFCLVSTISAQLLMSNLTTQELTNSTSPDKLFITYYNYQNDSSSPSILRFTLNGTSNSSIAPNSTIGFLVGLGLGADDMNNATFLVCEYINATSMMINQSNGTNSSNSTNSTNTTQNSSMPNTTMNCYEVYFANETAKPVILANANYVLINS